MGPSCPSLPDYLSLITEIVQDKASMDSTHSHRRRSESIWSKIGKNLPRIVGTIFMIAGAILVAVSGRHVLKANQAREWPSVTGKIISSETTTGQAGAGSGTGKSSETYGIAVVYEYQVNDTSYSSDVVAFGTDHFHGHKSSNQVLKKYPANTDTTVFYDPEAPDTAVLEPGFHMRSLILPGGGTAFFLGGCFMFFFIPGDPHAKEREAFRKFRESR